MILHDMAPSMSGRIQVCYCFLHHTIPAIASELKMINIGPEPFVMILIISPPKFWVRYWSEVNSSSKFF
jgi:hypothetical protein